MLIRWGKAGEFLGCSAYPDCGFTYDLSRDADGNIALPEALGLGDKTQESSAAAGGAPSPTGLPCPKCRKEMVVRRGKRGEFLGCSGYPKCRFTQDVFRDSQGKPLTAPEGGTGAYPCPRPDCQGNLVPRRSRHGIFYGCSSYPQCQVTVNQPPLARACPQCGFSWLMRKGKKILCPGRTAPLRKPGAPMPLPTNPNGGGEGSSKEERRSCAPPALSSTSSLLPCWSSAAAWRAARPPGRRPAGACRFIFTK